MNPTEKRRAFIIKVVYIALWAVLIFFAMKYALPLFMPFVLAFGLTFVLKPIINRLQSKTGWSRRVISILVLTLFYLLFGGLLVFGGIKLGVYIYGWLQNLPYHYANSIEPFFASITASLNNLFARTDPVVMEVFYNITSSISQAVASFVTSVSTQAVNMASSVTWFVVGLFLFIIASYFFVVDYYQITSFLTRQLPERTRRKLFIVKDYVVNTLFKYARAYLILMSITFVEVLVGLLILRVPNPVSIALLTAAVDILPVFGTGTVMIPWLVYSLLTGNYFLGIGLLVVYVIITVVRQVLEPRVIGRQIGLYPLLTLISMFVGTRMFGFWGLFALPITLTVLVHLNREGEISLFRE